MISFDFGSPEKSLERVGLARDSLLAEQIYSKAFDGCIVGYEAAPLDKAKELLPLAAEFSVAPISDFNVGAVAIGGSGKLYLGANLEFAGVPLSTTLHAEQSAILNARDHGETSVDSLVVSVAPCGHCRQFLWELPNAAELKLLFAGQTFDLQALLPSAFGGPRPEGESVMDSPLLDLEPVVSPSSSLAKHAIQTARKCYVPYSKSPEGLALECASGAIFTGSTVQSIAFNPTVSAIVGAMNHRNFSHSRNDAITAVVYAKLANNLSEQEALTGSLLGKVSDAEVRTITLEMV